MTKIGKRIEGVYILKDKKLQGAHITLLKGHRTKATSSHIKTPLFLLEVLPNGKRRYISSLWTSDQTSTYSFEYGGVRYDYIEESKDKVIIKAHG